MKRCFSDQKDQLPSFSTSHQPPSQAGYDCMNSQLRESVLTEQGAMTIPSVKKDPLETAAPKSFVSYETLPRNLISSTFQLVSQPYRFLCSLCNDEMDL